MSHMDGKKQKCILKKQHCGKKSQAIYKSFFIYHSRVTTAYSSKILDYKPESAFCRREKGCKIAKVL